MQDGAAGLGDEDAFFANRFGQARLDALDAVLHIDGSEVDVRARLEVGDDLHLPGRVARRLVVQDLRSTIQLFLDEPCHAVVQVLGRVVAIFICLGGVLALAACAVSWLIRGLGLYLTDFSASHSGQKYIHLTIPSRVRKLRIFNRLRAYPRPVNAGCSHFLVFLDANSGRK